MEQEEDGDDFFLEVAVETGVSSGEMQVERERDGRGNQVDCE